jgi:hypothetical protein
MLSGIILLWYILTAMAVVFVAIDIQSSPVSPLMRWAFVLFTAYTGPIGAFLYVLGCREPLPGLHADYVSSRWRQVLGSTMHCVAGDGIGILAGAVIGSVLSLEWPLAVALEYGLGFGFGWAIFQSLFMRGMAGGSYWMALKRAFMPEFLSMNFVMAGMVPVASLLWATVGGERSPLTATFWFVMSMALLAGFVVAYPINWWLVANNLKHGMSTADDHAPDRGAGKEAMAHPAQSTQPRASMREIVLMAASSTIVFGLVFVGVDIVRANMEMRSSTSPGQPGGPSLHE